MKYFRHLTLVAAALIGFLFSAFAQNYGLPAAIQDGNILHCFNWQLNTIKSELPNIAKAGFGAVQVSPLQRNVSSGTIWFDVYRPYDFRFMASSGLGNEQALRDLCSEAAKYGIKIIVDVVANHVDGSAGSKNSYHDSWWNSNNRLRWLGDVNYGNRYSITHNQLGGASGYPDVNSEDAEVAARAKSYIEQLKSMGVKGIRFDAAKHIALPSEGCNFWSTVTSVPDMYYYGEILESPGGSNATALMQEYTRYMSVTDDGYGRQATQANGAPGQKAGWANGALSENKVVYWGESHDTYANDANYGGWTKNLSQEQIDRGYAIVGCRKGATALYLSRPSAKNSGDIKIGVKGSTAYMNPQVAEVNKFRNVMMGKADAFASGNGVSAVTRQGGGAVIVANSGNRDISVSNASGYCPPGTYTDRVSGGRFTVTSSTISGRVGPSGIAVIYDKQIDDDDFGDKEDNNPDKLPKINGVYLNNTAGWTQPYVWAWTSSANCTAQGTWPGDKMTYTGKGNYWKWEVPAGKTVPQNIIFNPGSNNGQSADLLFVMYGIYDNYGNIIGSSGISDIVADDPEADTDVTPVYYNLQGQRVANPTGGIYIVVRGDKVSKEMIGIR